MKLVSERADGVKVIEIIPVDRYLLLHDGKQLLSRPMNKKKVETFGPFAARQTVSDVELRKMLSAANTVNDEAFLLDMPMASGKGSADKALTKATDEACAATDAAHRDNTPAAHRMAAEAHQKAADAHQANRIAKTEVKPVESMHVAMAKQHIAMANVTPEPNAPVASVVAHPQE